MLMNLHNWRKRALPLALLVALSFALQACPEKEGPMERAGEKVDEAVQDTERKIEDATD
jgi:hypothetical protein